MTAAEVAARLKQPVELISAWERGERAPSYPQLEKLAYTLYKRPLALFFVPSPPDEPQPNAEFRSLPDAELGHLSRDTVLLIRKARAYQAVLLELYGDRNPVAEPLWKQVRLDPRSSVPQQAVKVRIALGVDVEAVRQCSDGGDALKLWRRAIERGGVHVFKNTFKQGELSGFCLWQPEFPIIFINNSTTVSRQIFSLTHELAHVLCDRSGISRFDAGGVNDLPTADRAIERFCNAIAAEVLVPSADFEVAAHGVDPQHATDDQFAALAVRYHVSRSVVLRRFLDRGEVQADFWRSKDREWAEQRRAGKGGNYYATQGAYISEKLRQEVMSRYSRRLITRNEAAEFLGVKPKNFLQFEDMPIRGAAA